MTGSHVSLFAAGIRIDGSLSRFSVTRLRRKVKNCFGEASLFSFGKLGTGNGVDVGMFIVELLHAYFVGEKT